MFDLETEADDGAQLRAMFGTRGIELPGLADTGFEAVADRADQLRQRTGIRVSSGRPSLPGVSTVTNGSRASRRSSQSRSVSAKARGVNMQGSGAPAE